MAEIATALALREPVNGIRIVGVDGPSGAGKSTLASKLAVVLAAPIIEIDDFVSWDSFAGWWPRFDAQVLTPLLAGRDATYQAGTAPTGTARRWQVEDPAVDADGAAGGRHL